MAGLFLDIRTLFLYASQRGAEHMEGKTVEQVRTEWDLEDDLTDAGVVVVDVRPQLDIDAMLRQEIADFLAC